MRREVWRAPVTKVGHTFVSIAFVPTLLVATYRVVLVNRVCDVSGGRVVSIDCGLNMGTAH